MHKVGYTGYALGFMSLDKEVRFPHLGRGDSGYLLSPGSPMAGSAQGPAVILVDWALQTDRQIPGRMQRLQGFAVGPLRLDLNGHVRHAQ